MGRRFLCRTAASFVSARLGITPKAPILPEDLGIVKGRSGGLIVVGSYVPKTTKQVKLVIILILLLFSAPLVQLIFFSQVHYHSSHNPQVEELKSQCSHILRIIEVIQMLIVLSYLVHWYQMRDLS